MDEGGTESPKMRWERLEDYLFDHEKYGTDFSVYEYAEDTNIDVPTGTSDIQAYLHEQRKGEDGKTLFVIHRVPGTRTRNARWAVGIKTNDARLTGAAFSDDTRAKAVRLVLDLNRISTLNKKAKKLTVRQVEATVDHVLPLLEMAARGMGPPGGWPDEEDE